MKKIKEITEQKTNRNTRFRFPEIVSIQKLLLLTSAEYIIAFWGNYNYFGFLLVFLGRFITN